MDKFYNSNEFGMAAHARSLATLRGHTIDKTGMYGLATEVLSQARPSAFLDPDVILGHVLANFGGDVWDSPATVVCPDPVGKIEAAAVDEETLNEAVQVLDRTTRPNTLEEAEEAESDLVILLMSIALALYLVQDVRPRTTVSDLSGGRVTTPTSGFLGAQDLWVLRYWTYNAMPTLRMGSKAELQRELILHSRRNWHDAVGKDGRGGPLTPPTDDEEAIEAFFGPISGARGYLLEPFQSDPDSADLPF